MKKFIILVSMLSLVCLGADKYVYVKEGKVLCGPRELPSVGVRQDNGNAVLALHGATDNVKAACGWYRVVAGLQAVGDNQVIVSTTYRVINMKSYVRRVINMKSYVRRGFWRTLRSEARYGDKAGTKTWVRPHIVRGRSIRRTA